MTLHTLHLEEPAADVLACALLYAIDDLEARAVIAEHHDPVIGPASALDYRTDLRRLQLVLDAIGTLNRAPSPERTAVAWIDGTWSIANGRPVRLHRQDDLEALLESSLDLVRHGLLDAHDALLAIHHLVATDRLDLATTTDLIDATYEDLDLVPETEADLDDLQHGQADPELQAACLPTHQAAHRLAPRCQPAPAHAAETGAGPC